MNSVFLRNRIEADGDWYLAVQGDQLVQQDLVSKIKKKKSIRFSWLYFTVAGKVFYKNRNYQMVDLSTQGNRIAMEDEFISAPCIT